MWCAGNRFNINLLTHPWNRHISLIMILWKRFHCSTVCICHTQSLSFIRAHCLCQSGFSWGPLLYKDKYVCPSCWLIFIVGKLFALPYDSTKQCQLLPWKKLSIGQTIAIIFLKFVALTIRTGMHHFTSIDVGTAYSMIILARCTSKLQGTPWHVGALQLWKQMVLLCYGICFHIDSHSIFPKIVAKQSC